MTKTVQNVANLVEFKTKEPFMTVLNGFIAKHTEKMKAFIDGLAVSIKVDNSYKLYFIKS